jgi:hypothetical protein
VTTDYPDLVLAAVLGGIVAGEGHQGRAAVLVTVLVAAYGALLSVTDTVPATVPLAIAFLILRRGREPWPRLQLRLSGLGRPAAASGRTP